MWRVDRGPGRLARLVLLAGVLPLSAAGQPVRAAADPVADGRAIAVDHCARCHAVEADQASPLAEAPPFRELKTRYPIDSLAEALAEGIGTGHPEMPAFAFEPDEIEALLAYLKTL